MVLITLPDGSIREFDKSVDGLEIAADIGPGLAKAALIVRVNGELWDLNRQIHTNSEVAIITIKDEIALDILRHDAAHVLAMAVQELYPDTQITFGPSTENGFYYDFYREEPFSTDDFTKIETRMEDIVDRNLPIVREVWDRNQASTHFSQKGEKFKAEWITDLPENDEITIYRQGDWIDLCRGPHLRSTGQLGKAFKLTKLAGAYWRGDAEQPQLQRIYGTCWRTKKELSKYLQLVEEAEKRDHRKLGQEMRLFHFQEEAKGSVFWHPNGWSLYLTCIAYMRWRLENANYVEVNTPELVDRSLWERSGHWEKFRENMFIAEVEEKETFSNSSRQDDYSSKFLALKPMNCPCHVQIFRQGIKSYRDLPFRMAEFGSCHRYEPSGALHGLMRLRAFVQDDAHIFCTENQISSETSIFIDLLASIYRDFGFNEFTIKFSDRPKIRAGSDDTWDKAENALMSAIKDTGIQITLNPGEGAFYGPKLEFILRDAIGRDWQCGTLQVDFVLPDRLDATYIAEDGNKSRPVMLHRAILGSFERFIGILLENFAGHLPLWLAPLQIVICTITSKSDNYARQVEECLTIQGLRLQCDLRNEKISYKIREHSHLKVPIILIIGEEEEKNETITIRYLGGAAQETLALKEAADRLKDEAAGPYRKA